MIHLRISEDALGDLADGFHFHEAQEAGLGDYFTSCLRAVIDCRRDPDWIRRHLADE